MPRRGPAKGDGGSPRRSAIAPSCQCTRTARAWWRPAQPRSLAAARRAAARRLGFSRPHERAHEFAFDFWRQLIDIETALGEELARILDVVDAPRLHLDIGKPRRPQLPRVLSLFERAGDAADPQLDAATDVGRNV